MPMSTYFADKVANVLRGTTLTAPATIYAALFTSSSSLAALKVGTLTNEVSGGSYARVAVTLGAPTDGDGSAGTVTFTTATAAWGTIRFAALMDASTSGNVLMYAQLTSDVTINNGNQFQFNSGSVAYAFD